MKQSRPFYFFLRSTAAIAAVALTIFGTAILQPQKLALDLLLCFSAASLLLLFGAGLTPTCTYPSPDKSTQVIRKTSLAGLLLSLLLMSASLFLFQKGESSGGLAWRCYFISLAVLIIGFMIPEASAARLKVKIPDKLELLGLLIVLAIAAAFRFHLLQVYPYGVWFDEAQNTLESLKIIQDPGYRPVFIADATQLPALLFYLYAPFVWLFGHDVMGVRLAATMAGLASVLFTWLLTREVFGKRTAFLAALLLACARWHVDFSRFGMAQIFTTLFIPLILLLFVRTFRRLNPLDAVLGGVALGLGLQTYYAMLAIALLMTIVFLYDWALGLVTGSKALKLFLLFTTAAIIAYAPVAQFAFTNWIQFNQRVNTVAAVKVECIRQIPELFSSPDSECSRHFSALWESTRKHISMFHLEGDRNGRHNLPGAPMLDPVTGALFALGFFWCLLSAFHRRFLMLNLWFGASICAGIFSLGFEAPQGARTIGIVPLLAIIAALPLSRCWQILDEHSSRFVRFLAGETVAALLLTAVIFNWQTYFVTQRFSSDVWASFSTPETKIGELMKEFGEEADVYVPESWSNVPSQQLIAGKERRAIPFNRAGGLPLASEGKGAIVFVPAHEADTISALSALYPHLTIEPFSAPSLDGQAGKAIAQIVRVSKNDIAELRGWEVSFHGTGLPERKVSRHDRSFSFENDLLYPASATASGALLIKEDGVYMLSVKAPAHFSLTLDGTRILEGLKDASTQLRLAQGIHSLALEADATSPGQVSLTWRTPSTTEETPIPADNIFATRAFLGGLTGSYYRSPIPEGEPAFQRVDPQVSFYFHFSPLPMPFSAIWRGYVFAPENGDYRFGTSSIDSSSVKVDEHTVVVNDQKNSFVDGQITLTQGWHKIEVHYSATSGYCQIYLHWQRPGGQREIIPSGRLRPLVPDN